MPPHKRTLSQPSTSATATAPTPTTSTNKRPKRTPHPKEKGLVERTNALLLPEFSAVYFPPSAAATLQSSPQFQPVLTTWPTMPPTHRSACLELIERTSLVHYQASELRWSRPKKRKEMSHPAMKYLLLLSPALYPGSNESDPDVISGFLSFMITEEDGHEVIYCYELHLQPSLQGRGLGKRMMEVMEGIGERVGVEKAMLTVFRTNERAIRAYQRWGYEVDEFSPKGRVLRNGMVREAGYVILSMRREDFVTEDKDGK